MSTENIPSSNNEILNKSTILKDELKDFKVGDSVKVERANGETESDWIYNGVNKEGCIIVIKKIPNDPEGKSLFKRIPPENFKDFIELQTIDKEKNKNNKDYTPKALSPEKIRDLLEIAKKEIEEKKIKKIKAELEKSDNDIKPSSRE